MKQAQVWYVLLPKKMTYSGPYDSNRILKLLSLGKIKFDTYIWSPQTPTDKWKMLAEYALFQKILASPRWLFSQPEEDFLEIYRLINHKDEKRTGRLSWYESHQLTTGTAPELNIPQASVDFTTAPLPLRSKRIELRQTINAKAGNYMQLAKQFILSRNGVYFNIKSASECPIGSKIDLTTVDMENQQILNLTGLVTSEVEATTGKNIGIRFIEIDRTQRTFIDRWVNSLNTKNTG